MFLALQGKKHKLVIVDEVIMLNAENLLILDRRLRTMYDYAKPFGRISILLVGDFMQLSCLNGTDLFNVMYIAVKGDQVQAKDHFSRFWVIQLDNQM